MDDNEETQAKKGPKGKKAKKAQAIARLSKVKPDFSLLQDQILPAARLRP